MSLESLTEAEKAAWKRDQDTARILQELLTDSDADTRRTAQRIAKKKRPDLRFPELEAEEAAERARASSREEVDTLRKELEQEKAQRLKAEETAKIASRGFDPEAVYKAMNERGIVNLDTALAMFEAEQQLAQSTSGSIHRFNQPKPEIPKEVISDNGVVDVEGLRSHLINQYVDETQGRKVNPLGFLRQ